MTQKLSVIFLGGSGSKIRQIHLSLGQIAATGAVFAACIGLAAYGCINYLTLRTQIAAKRQLEIQLSAKSDEADFQREQIQKFAADINDLKNRIVALDKFEDRIRILANLDRTDNKEGVFGVGGSAPEDLNPDAELEEGHRRLIKEMHRQVLQLGDASKKQQGSFAHLMDRLEEQKNMLAHTPAIRPVKGWVTSTFAYRQSPFSGHREFHKGLDIASRRGTPVSAPADGVVTFMGKDGGYGNLMVIDHGYGITTRYGHLEKGLKKPGDRVRRGDHIALIGNTGRSTGPHLHYEVRVNGLPVNPEKYILN